MSLRLDQRLEQGLEQKLLLALEQRLEKHVGNVEKQILEKIEFVNIDFHRPESRYHTEMLGEFLYRETEGEESFAGRVLREHGVNEQDLEKITIEGFEQEDVSLDIGTKRNVDRALLVLKDDRAIAVTMSLDKRGYKTAAESPSLQESQALAGVDAEKTWSMQRLYGSRAITKRGRVRGFVVKEFLEGSLLGEYTGGLPSPNAPEAAVFRNIAAATGRSMANALETTGGVPKDANPMNWIVAEKEGLQFVVRNCDVEDIVRDTEGINHEIRALGKSFGPFQQEFRDALPEAYRGSVSPTKDI